MSALNIPPGYGLWTFYLQHASTQHIALTTLGFKMDASPWTQSNNDGVLASFRTAFLTLWDNEITFARLVTLSGNDGPLIRTESTGTSTGTRTATLTLPPQVTYVLSKRTAFAGRQFRGRMYLPFVSSTNVSQQGAVNATEQTIVNTAMTAFRTDVRAAAGLNVDDFYLLHATPLLGSTPDPTLITSTGCGSFVGTQRRRLERN